MRAGLGQEGSAKYRWRRKRPFLPVGQDAILFSESDQSLPVEGQVRNRAELLTRRGSGNLPRS